MAIFAVFNSLKNTGPIPVRYYLYMIDQNYAQAYTYLDSNATINGQQVNQQSFSNLATAADARDGKVTGFALENGGDSTHVTVQVQRGNLHYVVHLQLKQEGSELKIISADGI